ncbi:MAG: hypothetical protein ACFCUX_04860 [Candidatus Methylacidiphilales bacterium]
MKKVILDENVPIGFRYFLSEFEVVTVDFLGWNGTRNGALIRRIERIYDVLVTGDKNLRYQQNLMDRRVSIVELPFTRIEALGKKAEEIRLAIRNSSPGSYTQIKP